MPKLDPAVAQALFQIELQHKSAAEYAAWRVNLATQFLAAWHAGSLNAPDDDDIELAFRTVDRVLQIGGFELRLNA